MKRALRILAMTDCVNIGTHVVTRAIWLKWLFNFIFQPSGSGKWDTIAATAVVSLNVMIFESCSLPCMVAINVDRDLFNIGHGN